MPETHGDAFPATLGPPHHHADERECFCLRADPTQWAIWRHEDGRAGHPGEMCDRVHPCVDKACCAVSPSTCRYPGWRLCGHPAPVPHPTATDPSDGGGGCG